MTHFYLFFEIQNKYIQKIGSIQLVFDTQMHFDIYKNPDLAAQRAIDAFKQRYPEYENDKLRAFFTGDIIPVNTTQP